MRGIRSFLVLFAVAAGLGAYLYFVESKRDPSDKERKVFSVEADKIDEMTIKSESGERTTLKKTGTDWQIVEPVTAPTDSAAVSGLTSNLSTPSSSGSSTTTAGRRRVRADAAADRGHLQGRQGAAAPNWPQDPPATDLCAKIADQKRVFLIPSFVDTTFNKTTFDLRDKTVLKVERDKIDTLSITSPKRVLQFTKADGEWKMALPVKGRADFTTVDGLVSRLSTLQTKSIVAPGDSAGRLRARQTRHYDSARIRLLTGDAPPRQERRGRRRLRQGSIAAGDHRSNRPWPMMPARTPATIGKRILRWPRLRRASK